MRSGSTLNDFMQWDNTLFDDIVLNAAIDRGLLVSTIMLRCGLQNPLYEHYDVFKSQVKTWFAAHEWNFDKLVKLIQYEYEPLWNKEYNEERDVTTSNTKGGADTTTVNGTIAVDDTHSGTDARSITDTFGETGTFSENGTITENGQVTENGSASNQSQQINSVKGFNASDWQETDKIDTNGSSSDQRTTTDQKTTTDNRSSNTGRGGSNSTLDNLTHGLRVESDTVSNETRRTDYGETNAGAQKETYKGWGNIGVMSSQDLFRQELELLDGFNLYEWIAKKFDDDLMIGVYVY